MSRITAILTNVRDTLNDLTKVRWTDETLLRLLDKGQKDIAKQAEIFRDIISVPLITGEHTYKLPEDTITITRVQYKNKKLPLVTNDYMDNRNTVGSVLSSLSYTSNSEILNNSTNSHWMSAVSETDIVCVVFDKLQRHRLRVWPRPISDDLSERLTSMDSLYGITVSLDTYTMIGTYGEIGTIIDTDEALTVYEPDNYGVLTEVIDSASLIVYRTKEPPTIDSLLDELLLDPVWDSALENFIAGMAFKNDINAQNRALGDERLVLYNRDLDKLKKVKSTNSVATEYHGTNYNGMG